MSFGIYTVLCSEKLHVHVFDRDEMVEQFGEEKVSAYDAGDLSLFVPGCAECSDLFQQELRSSLKAGRTRVVPPSVSPLRKYWWIRTEADFR